MYRSWATPIAIVVAILAFPATSVAATPARRVAPVIHSVQRAVRSMAAAPAAPPVTSPQPNLLKGKPAVSPKPPILSPGPPHESTAARNRAAYLATMDRRSEVVDHTMRLEDQLEREEALERTAYRANLALERQEERAAERWNAVEFERIPYFRYHHIPDR